VTSDLSKKIAFLKPLILELIVYACFVSVYVYLVLHFLSDWIKQVFDNNRPLYAILGLVLIVVQSIVLERLTSALVWIIERIRGGLLVLQRLARPHETVVRPKEAPGLMVYRFAGPLLFFNADHFANRAHELIDSAQPAVTTFLINAEAIVDIDAYAVEILEELYDSLEEQDIVLAICEVKGHFLEVLRNTRLTERSTFNLYPSVQAMIEEIMKGGPNNG